MAMALQMVGEPGFLAKTAATVFLGVFGVVLLELYRALVWRPARLGSKLEQQGIRGPPPSFFLGNLSDMKRIVGEAKQASMSSTGQEGGFSHAWPSVALSHLVQWRAKYGPNFLYYAGKIPFLCVMDLDLVKEVTLCTSPSLGKASYQSKELGPLFGEGIVSSNGLTWAFNRKIIAPELYLNKIQGMVGLMADSTDVMLRSWEKRIQSGGGVATIEVDGDLRSLTADIISRACFGSSYDQAKEIFVKVKELLKVMSAVPIGIPGLRYLPTRTNREVWRLEKEIDSMILRTVKSREGTPNEKDLMQTILDNANKEGLPSCMSSRKFIVDNCKTLYLAGHETTATTTSWCLMLLAANPEWQSRAREEVAEVLDDGPPNSAKLRGMKTLTMVIHETLRLYAPAVALSRQALEDVRVNNLLIPKGCLIQLPLAMLHRLPEIWGDDSDEFNPRRFANGLSGACKAVQAYMPLGFGPRVCAGQHLAMAELKVVLSLILSKFSFSLSPDYQHSPEHRLVLEPGHGVVLQFRKL